MKKGFLIVVPVLILLPILTLAQKPLRDENVPTCLRENSVQLPGDCCNKLNSMRQCPYSFAFNHANSEEGLELISGLQINKSPGHDGISAKVLVKCKDIIDSRLVMYPPPEFLKKFSIIHDVCVEKTGVTEDSIKEFSDGDIHEDPALKCYMNCIFHEVNIVDDDGELHYEKFRRMVPDDLAQFVQTIIDTCEAHVPKGSSLCDRAWSWNVCFKETDPVHYFLP